MNEGRVHVAPRMARDSIETKEFEKKICIAESSSKSIKTPQVSTPENPKLSNVSPPSSKITPKTSPSFRKFVDEDDTWSVVSSTFSSIRATKPATVGIAPSFRSSERAERRKEYYAKLEEKHRALMAEKNQAEARTREEHEAAIKQLRRSMVVKANPVPSFYYEAPPQKPELKKLPLTRPRSPKLNRRKSCNDASLEDQGKSNGRVRHSLGGVRGEKAVIFKPNMSALKDNGCKVKDGL